MSLARKYYSLLVVLILGYFLVTFLIPPDAASLQRYHMSVFQSRLLSLSIVLPFVLIWMAAFYGFINFKNYANSIKNSPDGKSLSKLANGLAVLAIGMPFSSILSSLVNFLERMSKESIPPFTIATNYISICIAVLGFTLIAAGASGLLKIVKTKAGFSQQALVWILLLSIGGVYIYLTLTNPIRQNPSPVTGKATYFLPDWLIVITIIIPYLYVWYSGLKAAINLNSYQKNVKGLIYKNALKLLTIGIASVIFSSVFLQFFTALSSGLLNWGLTQLLVLIYVLLIIIAAGYVFIALGAKKLKKFEEV